MHIPSYIFLRRDSGSYFFRWAIPTDLRPLLNGRTEIRRTLSTDNRLLAIRLGRRLAVMLDRAKVELMARNVKETPSFALVLKVFERLADGGIRIEGLEMDPTHAEEERKHLAALLGTPLPIHNASTPTAASGHDIADLVKAYLAEKDRGGKWTSKTRQEYEATYDMLTEILGAHRPLYELTAHDLRHFKETLTKLPANRSKDRRYRGKSAVELAVMKIATGELLNVTTINKVLNRISSLLNWGVINGYVKANYAKGMSLGKGKRDDEGREPYTDAEVNLLRDAVLKGTQGAGDVPWKKWIPLIGIYSGMRLNEICQLAVSDFSEENGVPVISVNDDEGKRVKTANSRRYVPVHPELIAAGLPEYVNAMRTKGARRLFPELSKGRDGYGKTPSRWFSTYRKRIGLKKDFHSLRHTVSTKLREAGVPEDVVADILGHSRSERETFGTYAKAASVTRKLEALRKLRYDSLDDEPKR